LTNVRTGRSRPGRGSSVSVARCNTNGSGPPGWSDFRGSLECRGATSAVKFDEDDGRVATQWTPISLPANRPNDISGAVFICPPLYVLERGSGPTDGCLVLRNPDSSSPRIGRAVVPPRRVANLAPSVAHPHGSVLPLLSLLAG